MRPHMANMANLNNIGKRSTLRFRTNNGPSCFCFHFFSLWLYLRFGHCKQLNKIRVDHRTEVEYTSELNEMDKRPVSQSNTDRNSLQWDIDYM